MPGFCFTADWHLSNLTWQHRPRIVRDSFFSLQQIADFACENHADIIGAGDLLDKDRPDPAAVGALCGIMTQLQSRHRRVYYTQGQHERAVPTWLAVHEWPQHVHDTAFQIDGLRFYGLDWQPAGQFQQAMERVPAGTQFLVAHQVWMEHMGNVVAIPEANVHVVPTPWILTGDYHQHQITSYGTPHGPRQLVSPGSISMRSITEPPAKAFYYWTGFGFDSIPLLTRPCVTAVIATQEHLDHLVQQVAHAEAQFVALADQRESLRGYIPDLRSPLVSVKYSADIPNAYQQLTTRLAQAHLWLEELPHGIEERPIELSTTVPTEVEQTLPELVSEAIQDQRLRGDVLTLLLAEGPPTQIVSEWLQQINTEEQHAAGTH